MTCSINDCTGIRHARGWCNKHYLRWRAHGDPLVVHPPNSLRAYPRIPVADRLWARVEKTETCWNWTGATSGDGYGVIGLGGADEGVEYVHRVAYSDQIGPIPAGLQIDHLYFNRVCVRPDHLEAVTQQVNVERENARRWAS